MYTKTNWVARVGTALNRFLKANETTGSVELTADPTGITTNGTPFSTANMNKIEDGIYNAHYPTFTENPTLTNIASGEVQETLWGKVKKAIASVITHDGYLNQGVKTTSSPTFASLEVTGAEGVRTAGDFIIFSGNGRNTTSATYVECSSQIKLKQSGTIRISFNLWVSNSSSTGYGIIYKNGIAVGTERSRTSTAAANFIEDVSFSSGDIFTIWAKNSGGYITYIANFEISCNEEGVY